VRVLGTEQPDRVVEHIPWMVIASSVRPAGR
jgi:hypothetical protein